MSKKPEHDNIRVTDTAVYVDCGDVSTKSCEEGLTISAAPISVIPNTIKRSINGVHTCPHCSAEISRSLRKHGGRDVE